MSTIPERTFRTDGGNAQPAEHLRTLAVRGLSCRLKKLITTDEGKIVLAIEMEASDPRPWSRSKTSSASSRGRSCSPSRGCRGSCPCEQAPACRFDTGGGP